MKHQSLITFVGLSVLVMLTAISASAQSQRVEIPFSFVAGEKTLPAGEYSVAPDRKDSDRVWLLQSRAGDQSVLIATMSTWANKTPESGSLVFHKYEDQYFLSQIWLAGSNAGRGLPPPRKERELAKRGVERTTVAVLVAKN